MLASAVGRCEQDPDLVAGPVKLSRLAAGCAVEEIDHTPCNILGVRLQGRIGKHREKVGPDYGEDLLNRVLARKVGGVEGGWPDAEPCKVEAA